MDQLIAIAGEEHVTGRSGEVAIAPATTEEVSSILALCSSYQPIVSPIGAGTKMEWGNALKPSVMVHTRRLAGVREHSWGDLTATVGAGTTWSAMQVTLAQHGQRVALDPLFPERATVGGVIATNDSGALRMRYGSLRDLVLGMTIVLADGTIARTGGKVVKNVAGYDLPKLLTGSFGTLGIITDVTFRLHPLQAHTATWTVRSPEITPLADLMHKLVTAGMSLEALQLRNDAENFALDIQFASLPEVLAEHEARLREFVAGLQIEPAADNVWLQRERIFDAPDATVVKITALPTKLAALVAGFQLLAQQPDCAARCVADPVGIVTAAISAPAGQIDELVGDLRARIAGSGGSVVVLRRGALAETTSLWGPPPAAIDIMRAIKQEFDPQRLLNPGKFVGGI